jgi:hypothetical protein
MDVDTAIGEIAKDAAAEADRVAAGEAAKTAQDEATKGTAEGAGQETGDHTDGIPAAGAPGATPATEPPTVDETVVEDQPSTSDVPSSSRYLRVGDNLFVSLPGTASTGVPSEGESFDEEVLAAAGLKIVDEPRTSSGSKEEQLLLAINDNFQKLQALHRGRKESLDSRAAVVKATEANFQKRVEETQIWYAEALQELATGREQLSTEWNNLLLARSDAEKAQEEAAQQAAAEEARLTQRRVGLDAYAEDLAAREAALAAKLRSKDEELEKLVAQRTQELEQKHKEALEAHITDHASKLKEAVDAAEAAEAAKNELAGKVKELEADLEKHGKEISTLKADRDKTLHTLAEMQTTISGKIKELSAANGSIDDLKLKLTTLEETLEVSRARERTLTTDLQNEKNLLKSAAANYNDFEKGVKIWTERLVDVAQRLDAELSTMGLPNFSYPSDERVSTSARLTMFFEGLVDALKLLRSNRAAHLANESRKLCRAVLSKVLTKVAYRNPGLNLTNVLASLPETADLKALEELVAPIVDRVSGVKRVEGQRRD